MACVTGPGCLATRAIAGAGAAGGETVGPSWTLSTGEGTAWAGRASSVGGPGGATSTGPRPNNIRMAAMIGRNTPPPGGPGGVGGGTGEKFLTSRSRGIDETVNPFRPVILAF